MVTTAEQVSVQYRERAEEFTRRALRALKGELKAVVLYGSVARREARPSSDIDLFVLVKDRETINERLTEVHMGMPLMDDPDEGGVQVYPANARLATAEALEPSALLQEVARDGIVLHDDGTFAVLRMRLLMTGPEPEVYARQELEEAQDALRDARILLDNGSWAGASDRAYYVMLHSAKAGLWGRPDRMPHSHDGVRSMFGRHLVLTGLADARLGNYLGNGWELRLRATYGPGVKVTGPGVKITEGEARTAVAHGEEFLGWARQLLGEQDSHPAEPSP